MQKKKHILLLTTGGTIASVAGGEGLEPHRSGIMEQQIDELRAYYVTYLEHRCSSALCTQGLPEHDFLLPS